MLSFLFVLALAQSAPSDAFSDPALVPGVGLEAYSEALGNTLQWESDERTRFRGSRWVGGSVVLQRTPNGGLVQYAQESLSNSLNERCYFYSPHYEASYEGAVVGTFTIRCDEMRTVFAYHESGSNVELFYFNRDGRTMATAAYDLLHAPRQLFVVLDRIAARHSLNIAVPFEVVPLEYEINNEYQ